MPDARWKADAAIALNSQVAVSKLKQSLAFKSLNAVPDLAPAALPKEVNISTTNGSTTS